MLLLLVGCQPAKTQITSWIEKQTTGDSLFITGMLRNAGPKAVSLHYVMEIIKSGPAGQSRNNQSGQFKAEPNTYVALAKTIVNASIQDHYRIVLSILDQQKIIRTDTLQQGMPPSINTTTAPKVNSTSDAIEIDGLIIDETRSKPARDFYELFYNKWSPPPNAKDYSITIRELPSRGRSARIAVEVNDQVLLQRFLQPRYELIGAQVEQAIRLLRHHLDNTENLKQQMGNEDQKGSGIY